MGEGGVDGLSFLSQISLLEGTTCNKESVIVSAVISMHVLGKKGQIKTLPIQTKCTCSLCPWCCQNCLIGTVGVDGGYRNGFMKTGKRNLYEREFLMGIVGMVFWASKVVKYVG